MTEAMARCQSVGSGNAAEKEEHESADNPPAGVNVSESVSLSIVDPSRPAALTIDPRDIISYLNTWTMWGNQSRFGTSFRRRR
jgi:hypothetical protein